MPRGLDRLELPPFFAQGGAVRCPTPLRAMALAHLPPLLPAYVMNRNTRQNDSEAAFHAGAPIQRAIGAGPALKIQNVHV